MTTPIPFLLDGDEVEAHPGETILDCALRLGRHIEHQCCDAPHQASRPGRCRSCLVEVEGEETLKASCREAPRAGMRVLTQSPKAREVRATLKSLRESAVRTQAPDTSHPAIMKDPQACILCGACVQACREVQCHDVLGLAGRGAGLRIVFDLDVGLAQSACVACGQCIEACPTGALRSRAYDQAPPHDAASRVRVTQTLCPYCNVGCFINVHVRDNRIVGVTAGDGPTNQGRLCVKGRFGQDFVQHPDRLTVPLIRLAQAEKGRPVDDWRQAFRPASWDEALEAAARGLQREAEAGGPDSLGFFGSLKTCNEDGYLLQKLARTVFHTNNVDHPTRLCHASSTAALLEAVGMGAPSTRLEECSRAEVILLMGANPCASHPVADTFIRNAVRAGAKLIVADPRGLPLDRFATHVLRFRPDSNVALLNAMIGVIIDEGLVDRAFVESRVEGFEEIDQARRAFPLERVAGICGVDAETIRAAARLYATAGSAMTIWGMGMTQHSQGTNNVRCLVAMALICGQVGRPGTGLYPIRGHNNAQGAPDSGMLPNFLPDYQPVASPEARARFADLWGREVPARPGLTMIEMIQAMEQGKITALYCMGANPAMCMPELARVRRALAGLRHLVVQDIFLTETAAQADVVLPAAALLEKEGTLTNIDRRIQRARAVLPPPGQARADWAIIQDLARKCGADWSYQGPHEVFGELRRAMPSIAGITWNRLETEGGIQYPCLEEDAPGTPFLFASRFNTPNGRARLTPVTDWSPDRTVSPEFPLAMTTGRTLEHHTGPMSRRAAVLDTLFPREYVLMNPGDMARLDIAPQARVAVRSRQGRVVTTALPDRTIPAGLVFAPFCFHEAPANQLTAMNMDPVSKTGELKFTAVAVEKA